MSLALSIGIYLFVSLSLVHLAFGNFIWHEICSILE